MHSPNELDSAAHARSSGTHAMHVYLNGLRGFHSGMCTISNRYVASVLGCLFQSNSKVSVSAARCLLPSIVGGTMKSLWNAFETAAVGKSVRRRLKNVGLTICKKIFIVVLVS